MNRKILMGIVLVGICFIEAPISAEEAQNYYQSQKICAEKIEKSAPQVEVPISAFSLERVSLEPHEKYHNRVDSYFYSVDMPLTKPLGKIETVWFYAELEEAITLLRLIREGKIKSLVVNSTHSDVFTVLTNMFPLTQKSEEVMKGLQVCSEESILRKMQFCARCRLKAYQGVMP
ncbi:MAG: hypothetical protein ABL935_05655 [Nitrospiraceae bacterium]